MIVCSIRELACICCLLDIFKIRVRCPSGLCLLTRHLALDEGYLERLFLKESKQQGEHFDNPKSVAKIVFPTK
jgi:hypothetical protein